MDCSLTDQSLIGYHFGALDDAERDRIDEHLLGCGRCLRAYLDLKRHVERHEGERPSEGARAKLRAEVIATFRPTLAVRARRALARPIPLYQGLAAAALVVLLVAFAPALARRATTSTPRVEQRIDSSRQGAASRDIY